MSDEQEVIVGRVVEEYKRRRSEPVEWKRSEAVYRFLCQKNGTRIMLMVALFLYITFGAWIFLRIERWNTSEGDVIGEQRRLLVEQLWNKSRLMSKSEWTLMTEELILNQEHSAFVSHSHKDAHDGRWTYAQSVFFCWTLLTTIGYGTIYPLTETGRVFTIAYGIMGIPLTVMVLSDLGTLLRKLLLKIKSRCWKAIHKLRRKPPSDEVADPDQVTIGTHDDLKIWHMILILVSYFFIGCLVYYKMESWNFLDSSYYIFVSLTTIGLGDLVPQTSPYLIMTCFYLLFGLVVMALFLDVIRMQMSRTAQSAANVQSKIVLKVLKEFEKKMDHRHMSEETRTL